MPPGYDGVELQWFTTNGPYTPDAPDFLEDYDLMKGSFVRTYDVNTYRSKRTPEWTPFGPEHGGEEMVLLLDSWNRSVPIMNVIEGQMARCDVWKEVTADVSY